MSVTIGRPSVTKQWTVYNGMNDPSRHNVPDVADNCTVGASVADGSLPRAVHSMRLRDHVGSAITAFGRHSPVPVKGLLSKHACKQPM